MNENEMTANGYTVLPNYIYSLPIRLRLLYFEVLGLVCRKEEGKDDPRTGYHMERGETPPITYSFLAERMSRIGLNYSAKMARDDLKKLGHNKVIVRSFRGRKAVILSITNYTALQALKSYNGHNKVIIESQRGKQTNVSNGSNVCNEKQKTKDMSSKTDAMRLIELFDSVTEGILHTRKISITDKRMRAAKKALAEVPDFDDWRRLFEWLCYQPFYTGQNDTGWKASIDYVLRSGKAVELLEKIGDYGRMKKCDICKGSGEEPVKIAGGAKTKMMRCVQCGGSGKVPV